MPKGESFRNPYRVLRRPGAGPDRRYARDVSSLGGYGGELACLLLAYTPLQVGGLTAAAQGRGFAHNPVIPGTSLKGLIRSLAEFIGGGCYGIETADLELGKGDDRWRRCRGRDDRVCITCSMFGTLDGRDALRGRVGFTDAGEAWRLSVAPARDTPWYLYSGQPRPHHRSFYPPGPMQKFYHHQPVRAERANTVSAGTPNATAVVPARRGSRFRFMVRFDALDAAQLALLHYTLALEPGLLHKLGRGRGHGMGSVRIGIDSVRVWQGADRYRHRREPSAALPDEVAERRSAYERDDKGGLDLMKRMLWWRPDDRSSYRYPGYDWFHPETGQAERSQVPLTPVLEVVPRRFTPAASEDPEPPRERPTGDGGAAEVPAARTHVAQLSLNPGGGGRIWATAADGTRIGDAAQDDYERAVAGLPDELRARLRKKKVLKRVRVTVEPVGSRWVIRKVEPTKSD